MVPISAYRTVKGVFQELIILNQPHSLTLHAEHLLGLAATATFLVMLQVYLFPSGASSLTDHPWWFALLAVAGLVTSFTSTLMFTALGSFYTRISDPDMGGSYLTLLNTIANMGELCAIVWPGIKLTSL